MCCFTFCSDAICYLTGNWEVDTFNNGISQHMCTIGKLYQQEHMTVTKICSSNLKLKHILLNKCIKKIKIREEEKKKL